MSSVIPAPKRVFRGRLARTLLLILLALSLVPVLAMGSMAYLRARSLLREQIFQLLKAATDSQSQQISQRVTTGYILLTREVANPYLIEALNTGLQQTDPQDQAFLASRQIIFDDLQTINHPKPFFNQFIVLKPDGTIYMASRREWEGKSLAKSPYFDQLTGQQSSLALNAPLPLYSDSFVIMTAVPYVNNDGSLNATILGIAESPTIRDLIDNISYFSTSQYFVTKDGQFIGANPFPNSFEKLTSFAPSNEQKTAIQSSLLTTQQNGTTEFIDRKNQPVLSAYNWLPDLEIGWVTEISEQSIYQQVNSLLMFAVVLFIVIATLMALIIWQATRRMVRPLTSLAQTVQSFADGRWEQRTPVTRNDEIGQLAYSFNYMADELSDLYYSLESKVEDRTYQIQTASEAAQIAISSQSLAELIQRITWLIHKRFEIAYAAIYLTDTSGKFAIYQGGAGPEETMESNMGYRIEIDPSSTIGWVITANQPKILHFNTPDRITAPYRAGILAGAQAEAGIPLAIGDQVLGALDVQSYKPGQFNEENISELQNLANQIAPAVHSFQLLEATQIDLQETNLLYYTSRQIAQAETSEQVIQVVAQALEQSPYATIILLPDGDAMQVVYSQTSSNTIQNQIPKQIELTPVELRVSIRPEAPILIFEMEDPPQLPDELIQLTRGLRSETIALLPVIKGEHLNGLLIMGAEKTTSDRKHFFTPATLQPYMNLIELATMALEKIQALGSVQKRYAELQTLQTISETISFETDLQALLTVLHEQINRLMGEVDFLVAFYDPDSNRIHVPYIMENGESLEIEPFPLGEGLTSILINTQKPLLLTGDAEQKARELGAKVSGLQAKSWLGVPLLIENRAIGAMVVQDHERENRFTEDDLRLMNTLASQVAVAARNTQLLENSRQKAERERIAAHLSSRVWASNNIQSILQTALKELGDSLHASEGLIQLDIDELPSLPTERIEEVRSE